MGYQEEEKKTFNFHFHLSPQLYDMPLYMKIYQKRF